MALILRRTCVAAVVTQETFKSMISVCIAYCTPFCSLVTVWSLHAYQSPHKQQHLHAYGMSCMLQASQQQSKNMQQQQSQQNALLQQQQPDKTVDLAITATPTTQTQGQDVNAVYAEIVDNLKGVVQRLDRDGQSAALDAELKDQGQAAVSG